MKMPAVGGPEIGKWRKPGLRMAALEKNGFLWYLPRSPRKSLWVPESRFVKPPPKKKHLCWRVFLGGYRIFVVSMGSQKKNPSHLGGLAALVELVELDS